MSAGEEIIVRPRIGDAVIYTDSSGNDYFALVTMVYSRVGFLDGCIVNIPCVNLIIVSPNPIFEDQYGRRTEQIINVIHALGQVRSDGNYWRWAIEDKIEY